MGHGVAVVDKAEEGDGGDDGLVEEGGELKGKGGEDRKREKNRHQWYAMRVV